jgi:ABC-2 type transport system ATP-binding protein
MSQSVLEIDGLSKNYGKTRALHELDLTVEKGQIFGLLGPNGSGKTTTLGIVMGAINKSSGKFRWFEQGDATAARLRIGSILEQPSFYHYLSAEDNLKVVCAIKKVSTERIDKVLERVDLLHRKKDPFKTYSLGMKQRLAIASALLSDPEVMILDEPTNGLDPQGIAEMRELIIELAAENRTIILASHLLDEVQKICSHFAVLRTGKKIFQGSVKDLDSENILVEIRSEDAQALEGVINQTELVAKVNRHLDIFEVQLKDTATIDQLHKYLIDKGIVLNLLRPQPNKLEKKFLEVLREGRDD